MRQVTFTNAEAMYRFAFDQVCDPIDWKAPIDCEVPYNIAYLYTQAIEFMTGVKPTGTTNGVSIYGMYRLQCCGYALGPCA